MKKRNLFSELAAGIKEIKLHEAGKITLKGYRINLKTKPQVTPELIRDTKECLNLQ